MDDSAGIKKAVTSRSKKGKSKKEPATSSKKLEEAEKIVSGSSDVAIDPATGDQECLVRRGIRIDRDGAILIKF